MTTIILSPDLEERLTEEARQRGTTPELLALESLRQLFSPVGDQMTGGAILCDLLAGHIGTVNGTTEALSEDCGRRFAEGLAEQQRQGQW
ncbi:MAG: hypothetical protein IRY99_09065 [Isosphaeraceae bacterium]|nr:hypothetical protein [Isosphaeraceae bacterium]